MNRRVSRSRIVQEFMLVTIPASGALLRNSVTLAILVKTVILEVSWVVVQGGHSDTKSRVFFCWFGQGGSET